MQRVTGMGGVFFKARDAGALREWYRHHLGIDVEDGGGFAFRWAGPENPRGVASTVWSVFDAACDVDAKVDESEFGKFGWVMDP